jgi:hypothetical protein
MLKSIKKSLNFLMALVAVVLLLFFIAFFIFQMPAVQTFLIKGAAKYISKEIRSTITVGKVDLKFFNRLEISDILIKDRNNDTLLYSKKITAGLRQFSRKKGIIKLGRVTVVQPVIGLITDSSGVLNLNWYLDMLQKPKDSTSNNTSLFSINQIDIRDGRFSLINRNAAPVNLPIDFNNLIINDINGIVENLKVQNDSTSLDIYDLGFLEKNGFVMKRLKSSFHLYRQNIVFNNLSMLCDSSIINADRFAILADSAGSFRRFLQEIRLEMELKRSLVSSRELKYFIPALKDFNETLWLSGNVSGTISELKGRNIKLSYKDETSLDCDFDFSGLPDINNTFIFLEVNDFRSVSKDIEQIDIPGKGKILLPEVLRKLGVVSFSGTFTGFIKDFVTYAKINTNKGLISTDISMRPEGNKRFRIKGLMRGSDIDLASITGNEILFGKMTIGANVDGYTDSFKTFAVNLTGKIDSIEINNYKYRDILLNGSFTDKTWDGSIKIDEKNIHMDLLGMFNFSEELPEFDFTLNLQKANLYNLLISKNDTSASASMLLTANFKGSKIDNINGEIRLLNSNFRKFNNNLEIYDFSLKAFTENSRPSITLRTDFIDANLYGHYVFSGLKEVIRKAMASLVPSKYGKTKSPVKSGGNDFVFDIKIKNTDKLNSFLRTGILIAENSTITGSFLPDSIISVKGSTKMFALNNNVFQNLSFEAKYIDSTADVKITSSALDLSGLSILRNFRVNLSAEPDHFNFGLYWDNKETVQNHASFEASGIFTRNPNGKEGKTLLRADLKEGEAYIRGDHWKINPSEILVDSSSVKISRFSVSNNENYFLVEGAVSENSSDTLFMKFNGISLNPLNYLYEKQMKNDPNMMHLAIGGTLNGSISLTNLYRNFMFESDITMKDFTLLGSQYGMIKIGSVWNNSRRVAEISANNDLNGKQMLDISGYYDPRTKKIDLNGKTDKLPVDVLNPLLKMFASGITGTASGKINLAGELSKPVLSGSLWAQDGTIKIDYLQTRFRFNDSIRFDKSGIKFNNVQAKDDKGNTMTVNGAVYNKYFKDWAVDLTLKANGCMVLNTKEKDNELFYGTAYASGVTTIKSVGPVLKFDISARTGKNTRFFIPLNSALSVAENNFITFIDTNKVTKKENVSIKPSSAATSSSGMEINFDLEVTPDAEVQLVMDPKAGDIIKGTGTGNLNINLDKTGNFKIYGDYNIDKGDYLFTLGNIINKSFSVEHGGKVSFNGNVDDADIDLKAIYKTKASLYDIMPEDVKLKEKIPVECQLILTGKLFNPVVAFDIYLPTADEKTRSYLKSMIKSDEEMSRQFLFLLVMNSFYADMSGSTPSTAAMGSTTVGVTTMEMVSNQLSNWLSKISNDFDIGVVYRPGSTAIPNSQELQVALSTQILSDRVTFNGNFDVAGNKQAVTGTGTTSNNSITGAFDIEYRPKVDGKIRFKFFNRSNDNFYINNGIQYTQGIGIFYREDFNKLIDLLKKPVKSDMKKEKKTKAEQK